MSRCYVVLPRHLSRFVFFHCQVWLIVDAATSNTADVNSGLGHLKNDATREQKTERTHKQMKYVSE